MKVVLFGASGTIGSAAAKALKERGHEVLPVSRRSKQFQADMRDIESLRSAFKKIGSFDAVACAAGDVSAAPLEQSTDEQWTASFAGKVMGQINIVRAAHAHISDRGSFTLVSGILTDDIRYGGSIGTTINYAIEGFVKAAAVELPRGIRINCISPTVLTESP